MRKHHDGYRAVLTILGKRTPGPTKATPEEASEWAEDILRNKDRALGGTALTLKGGYGLLVGDLKDTGGREGTLEYYKRAYGYLAANVGGADVELYRIDGTVIRSYIERRQRHGVSLATIVRKELGTLRRIVRLAIQRRLLGRDPFADVRLPRIRQGRYDVLDAPTVEGAIAAMRASGKRHATLHADIVELIWRTSLRRSELARLRVADIDLPGRRLFVDGKTMNRYRPIAQQLVPVLERLKAAALPDGSLGIEIDMIERVFERWRERLGLAKFSPHVLRHTFATDLLARGVAPHLVSSLMGHSGIRMLDRYFHAQDSALRAAVACLGGAPASSGSPPSRDAAPDPQATSRSPAPPRRSGSRRASRSGSSARTDPAPTRRAERGPRRRATSPASTLE